MFFYKLIDFLLSFFLFTLAFFLIFFLLHFRHILIICFLKSLILDFLRLLFLLTHILFLLIFLVLLYFLLNKLLFLFLLSLTSFLQFFQSTWLLWWWWLNWNIIAFHNEIIQCRFIPFFARFSDDWERVNRLGKIFLRHYIINARFWWLKYKLWAKPIYRENPAWCFKMIVKYSLHNWFILL